MITENKIKLVKENNVIDVIFICYEIEVREIHMIAIYNMWVDYLVLLPGCPLANPNKSRFTSFHS